MEILYGIVLLITFIVGVCIGIIIPLLIKKYIYKINEEKHQANIEVNKIYNKEEKATSLTQEIIDEWQNGGIDNEQ